MYYSRELPSKKGYGSPKFIRAIAFALPCCESQLNEFIGNLFDNLKVSLMEQRALIRCKHLLDF